MAMSDADLTARYIGEVITLIDFDIPNGPTLRYTPSSSSNITFSGATYTPMPMSGSGFGSTTGAFKDAALSVSNIEQTFMTYLNSYKDMKGTKVKFIQTLSKYLSNSTKTMNEAHYVISQTSFNKQQIDFTLTHPLNQEGVAIPVRITTRDEHEFPAIGKWTG